MVVVQYPTTMHNLKDMAPDDNRIVQASASSIIAVSYEARPFGVRERFFLFFLHLSFDSVFGRITTQDTGSSTTVVHRSTCKGMAGRRLDT